MSTRLAAIFALVALAHPAWAEPPREASGSEAAASSTSSAQTDEANQVCEGEPAAEAQATSTSVQVDPNHLEAAVPAPEVAPRRPLTMKAWARDIRHALSLREFIQTSPVVVGGMKLYLEAEPIAVRQRPDSTSQLTFAFAPDRVVVLGAF